MPSGRVPICTVTPVGFAVGAGASQSLTLAPLHASHALFWGAWSRAGDPPGSSEQSISTDLCHSGPKTPGNLIWAKRNPNFRDRLVNRSSAFSGKTRFSGHFLCSFQFLAQNRPEGPSFAVRMALCGHREVGGRSGASGVRHRFGAQGPPRASRAVAVTGWSDMPRRASRTATAPHGHGSWGLGPLGPVIPRALRVTPGALGGGMRETLRTRPPGPRGPGGAPASLADRAVTWAMRHRRRSDKRHRTRGGGGVVGRRMSNPGKRTDPVTTLRLDNPWQFLGCTHAAPSARPRARAPARPPTRPPSPPPPTGHEARQLTSACSRCCGAGWQPQSRPGPRR